jgi:two-component system response regulator NreC
MAKIILADDHQLIRTALKSFIESIKNLSVIGEASNGREVIDLLKKDLPDIVIIDIAMPELNGLQTIKYLLKDHPQLKIIVLSMHSNEEYVAEALSSGASGYILKDSAPNELELAINTVLSGKKYLTPSLSTIVIEQYLAKRDSGGKKNTFTPLSNLTERQIEILKLLAEGNTVKEIASKLLLSVKTVDAHKSQIMKKLNIHSTAGLVKFSLRIGLIIDEY